jgi:hypothetical protein
MSRAISEPIARRLQDIIMPLDSITRRERYVAGDFPRADRVLDLSKRYRWDLYHEAMATADQDLKDTMGWYLDKHVDTVLRRLVAPLGVDRPVL